MSCCSLLCWHRVSSSRIESVCRRSLWAIEHSGMIWVGGRCPDDKHVNDKGTQLQRLCGHSADGRQMSAFMSSLPTCRNSGHSFMTIQHEKRLLPSKCIRGQTHRRLHLRVQILKQLNTDLFLFWGGHNSEKSRDLDKMSCNVLRHVGELSGSREASMKMNAFWYAGMFPHVVW